MGWEKDPSTSVKCHPVFPGSGKSNIKLDLSLSVSCQPGASLCLGVQDVTYKVVLHLIVVIAGF